MKLSEALEILSPATSLWINQGEECNFYKTPKSCAEAMGQDVDATIKYITVDGEGELTFEI